MLFSTAYFPPVEYFAKIAEGFTLSKDKVEPSVIYIEASENYQKQSYRNRCHYFAGDGVQRLSFPVVHENGTHTLPISQIKVDWSTPWPLQTKRAIATAYDSSACFEYYKDELFAILDSRPETLFELNTRLLEFFLAKTGIKAEIRFTDHYSPHGSNEYGEDLRELIHPKRDTHILEELGLKKPYFQVFSGKYGFKSNLSIMDLLFNEGPDSISYLKKL